MNKKKSKNKKQDKQSEKPVPRKKEEEQTEGTGRNSAQNPCYGLLVLYWNIIYILPGFQKQKSRQLF